MILIRRKAQLAYEFLLLFFFLTMLFTAGVILAAAASDRVVHETLALHLDDLGRSVQEEFYTVAQMPPGFTRNITLPVTVNNKPYKVIVEAHNNYYYLQLSAEDIALTYTLPSIDINNNLLFPPAKNSLVATGGIVELN